ncbi:hypothetical protein QRX60_48070 [Amycolatopsis mongoliensis]|uniref:Uncharacterized protein n=1 Tax=Amycolatopsis mongoliensis TaxID=715475 RepID=A0A9Y2NHA9_9PSEU|nr:hypothetical protein [Amycolatopsis sp. 4-36]WIY01694.1 hypothetical protein QRX60_48070 [Amycolatopsis sp. 4-36]
MGDGRRFWFPLAALGFAQLVMAVVALVPAAPATGEFVNMRGYAMTQQLHGLGTGGVGGTALGDGGWYSAGAVAVDVVPPAALGWLAGLACVVLAVAGWYWLSLRRTGAPPRPVRFVLGTLGALAALPLLDLVGAVELRLSGDVRGALVAALGLLVLAAYERSWFVLAVTVVFALVSLLFLTPVTGALSAAGVLFAAAFAVLLRRPRDTAADAP